MGGVLSILLVDCWSRRDKFKAGKSKSKIADSSASTEISLSITKQNTAKSTYLCV